VGEWGRSSVVVLQGQQAGHESLAAVAGALVRNSGLGVHGTLVRNAGLREPVLLLTRIRSYTI
jgi:hypothetical protein